MDHGFKCKTIKFIGKNMQEKILGIKGLVSIPRLDIKSMMKTFGKIDFTEIWNVCYAKTPMKIQATEQEKVFATHTFDKEPVSRIDKEQ